MKKTGILTYHTGYNYGASLQAFALQTTLKKFNIENEIINFETERFKVSREMFGKKPKRVKEVIKIVTRVPYMKELLKRQELFDNYTQNCLKISPLYRTEQEVIDHATDYDCIVCGSDQIWNLSQLDAPAANPLFFLNFEKKQKRVAYAPSFGKWVKEAPQHEDVFLKWLKEFDSISVRETSGADYLRSKGFDCPVVLDPTVLLDADEYDVICAERQIPEKYVLLFSWNCNEDVINAAKKVSRELGLPLYNIVPPPRAMGKGIQRKLDVGPREFLSMIKYADFVVTNSFHGTAFSTTYKKPYVSIVSGKADPRMESLLTQLGLEDHLVSADNIDIAAMKNTDFDLVETKKADLRKISLDYLKKAMGVEL